MRGVSYGFPAWAKAHVRPCTPAEVTRYFEDREVCFSKEYWRKLLRGDLRSAKIETWVQICDATGEPLSTFISYQPDGSSPKPRPRPRRRQTQPKSPASRFAAPPDIRAFYPTGDDQ